MPVMLANSFWSREVAWVASVASVATCQTTMWAPGSVEMGQEFKMSMSSQIWTRRTLWTSPRCWSQWSLASWMQNKKQAVNYTFAQWWLPIKINVYAGGDGLDMSWHVLICDDMWCHVSLGWYWKKITFPGKKITFPGKNIYSPWKRNLGSSGPVVLWLFGPLILWSSGPVVLWWCGML